MTIQEAIKSGKRHRRKASGNKWYPRAECLEVPSPYINPEELKSLSDTSKDFLLQKKYYWDHVRSEKCSHGDVYSSLKYCLEDIMADDWEIEE